MASTFPSYTFNDAANISNATALQAILKEFYGPQQVKSLVYRRNKWFGILHKEEDWAGEVVPIPIQYGNPQGSSRTFGTAVSNVGPGKYKKFFMQWTQDYQIVSITNLLQLASRNDAGAFVKGVTREMNGGMKNSENRWAGGLFRSSTGTIGSGTISAGVVTLADTMSITQFEVDQVLEASATDGGTALGPGALGYVISVNRAAGTFTVASSGRGGAAATPTNWTGTMFFRVQGDNNLSINGLADWLPTTAPAPGDAFNGVDRSADPTRLGGIRWNGTNQSIEEALVDAAALASREDGNPELALTNYTTFAALAKALGAKTEYINFEHDEVPGISYKGMRLIGADNEINIFADRSCPGKLVYGIDPDSWTLGSMKALPHILTELDGLSELRDPNNDATQVRIGGYGMLVCDAPGRNFVAQTQS